METVPNTFPSLFWGYAVIWVLLGAYIFSLGRRLGKIERERGQK
jgi:CcmD family protein